ncbi:Signal recognition particle 9 kDa protein, partial [Camponotus floridanus]
FQTRYTMKYCHNKGVLCLKLTDNRRCLQYKTEIAQDLKKMEKFIGNLMRHMASKDS